MQLASGRQKNQTQIRKRTHGAACYAGIRRTKTVGLRGCLGLTPDLQNASFP